ncbi:MAG: phosphate acyltransferase PlsX [Holosporaceae bacterium]|jgi:glycerol-3-phosphate acyltransferase PlsX|nr:phosphate acyltransferase PlsX [Holosporaceae bacterium]
MPFPGKKKTIAIDGMGGDNAPAAIFQGLAQLHDFVGYHYIIFGDQGVLKKHAVAVPREVSYEIVHADMAVTADMDVRSSLRIGQGSCMGKAIEAVQTGEAAAVVSSGNTGIFMALAKITLKMIEGIDRPAIASIIPGKNGKMVCLDMGANAECTVKNLVDFAIMGEALARSVFDKQKIKLALLNIGTEKSKGSRLVKKTSDILAKLFDDYVGFVEGNDFGEGNVDVIVTDGFTGNVALKTIEGTAKYIVSELKGALDSSILIRIGALLAMPALNSLKRKLDPRLYNGAILLGLNGVVVKGHGNSDDVGFANSLRFTIDILRNSIFDRIGEQLEKSKIHCASEYCEGK